MANRFRNYLLTIVLTFCSVAVLAAVGGYYLIATPAGAKRVVDFFLLRSAKYASISLGSSSGTIRQGLVLKNVNIRNWPDLGPQAIVHLQRVDVRAISLERPKIEITVFNGRLDLPNCEPVIFNAHYSGGVIRSNVYSKGLDVSVITRPFLPPRIWRNLEGSVSAIDLNVNGPLDRPRVEGHFYVDRIRYTDRTVREGTARADIFFSHPKDEWQMEGTAILETGLVMVHNTMIELLQSKAIFKGDVLDPDLQIFGTAQKDIYTIDLKIDGTLQNPQLHVRADPYLSEDSAHMLLGLGNWAPSDISFQENSERFGIRRQISEGLRVGFELEQLQLRPGDPATRPEYYRTLHGEYALTDKLSVDLDERLRPRREGSTGISSGDGQAQNESRLYLRYKNLF